MDYDYYMSLGYVQPSHEWQNATQIGCASRLTAAQRSVLIRLRFPEAMYKFTKKTHWFQLCNCVSPAPAESFDGEVTQTDRNIVPLAHYKHH